jgi:hypothetical protein
LRNVVKYGKYSPVKLAIIAIKIIGNKNNYFLAESGYFYRAE